MIKLLNRVLPQVLVLKKKKAVEIIFNETNWYHPVLLLNGVIFFSLSLKRSRFHQYWAIQAGLLTPLTFAWHHLSPLAAFSSGVYFLHNGR